MAQYSHMNKRNTPHKQKENRSHIILSIGPVKAFDKAQHPFMIKTLSKVGVEGVYLNIIKAMYEKPTANIVVNG